MPKFDSVGYQRYHDEQMSDDEPRPLTIPLPPGFPRPFPQAGMRADQVFVVGDGGPEPEGVKEHEDLMFRRVPREIAMRYRAAAGGRGLTHAQYLTALVELHARLRAAADAGDEKARTTLDELGLQTVAV